MYYDSNHNTKYLIPDTFKSFMVTIARVSTSSHSEQSS